MVERPPTRAIFAFPPPLPVLTTARLLLRPYQSADADDFFAVLDASRARLKHSFPDRLRAVPTRAAAPPQLAMFADDWRRGRFYVFGIWRRTTGEYLGDICLMPQAGGQAEIGYYLDQQFEGHGYAREALAAIVEFGFGPPVRAARLLIRCFADNERAQAVAQAVGFRMADEPTSNSWFRFSFWDSRPAIRHFYRSAA